MVLTYSMVLDRLDTLNHREQQVRKFYRPLPSFKKEKPYPRRHRFADVLEPGDVVRTIDKGGDGVGWDDGLEHDGEDTEGAQQSARGDDVHSRGAEDTEYRGLRENRAVGPGRESQRLVKLASTQERQLRKMIDVELNDRKERLKSRLYREAGVAQDGEKAAREDENDKIDPLWPQVGKAQMMFPKPSVHKTGTATALEIKVGEHRTRYTGGTVFKAGEDKFGKHESDLGAAEQHPEQLGGGFTESEHGNPAFGRSSSIHSATSGRGSGFQAATNAGAYSAQEAVEEKSGSLYSSEDEDTTDMFKGPVSTWGYRKSVYSEHDAPERREFYFTQLTLPPSELAYDPAENTYIVSIVSVTDPHQPQHECAAAGRNEQSKLLFQRAGDTDGTQLSSVLSVSDELPWVQQPNDLMGHQLKITICRRSNSTHEDTWVSDRLVSFRQPPAQLLPAIPSYPRPPTSAPENSAARHHGRQHLALLSASSAAARPGTAPAISPTKGTGRVSPPHAHRPVARDGSASSLRGSTSPNSSKALAAAPAARWNSWAESEEAAGGAGAPMQNPMVRELSQENKSFEESPAAKKKRELARMRQQMRASLQQTQSQVLASMGGTAPSAAAPAGGQYLGAETGTHAGGGAAAVAAPMKIQSRPTSSAHSSSPGRPSTSQSVRFR